MDVRALVAGEAYEARLALPLGLVERLQDAALGVGQLGVVVEGDAVDLPQVEVIGLKAAQRSRRACNSLSVSGLNPRATAKFWCSTSCESMPLMVTATGRLMA